MPRAALGTAREVYLGKSIEGVLRRREVRCTWALVRNQGVACACAWCACAIKLVHAHVTCCMHMCMHMCMCMRMRMCVVCMRAHVGLGGCVRAGARAAAHLPRQLRLHTPLPRLGLPAAALGALERISFGRPA